MTTTMTTMELPIACDPAAIPEADRAVHARLARRLFGGMAALPADGREGEAVRVTFDAGALDDLAAWVSWERLCCPFLRFTLDVSPAGGSIALTMSGPVGTLAFLEAELGLTLREV